MPLSPEEAEERRARAPVRVNAFQEACDSIDLYLLEVTWPAYWDCRGISSEIVDRIISTYRGKNWDVELIYDDRDGNCLKFSKRLR